MAGAMGCGCTFAIYFSQNWHISCTFQKKIVPLRRKGHKYIQRL